MSEPVKSNRKVKQLSQCIFTIRLETVAAVERRRVEKLELMQLTVPAVKNEIEKRTNQHTRQ